MYFRVGPWHFGVHSELEIESAPAAISGFIGTDTRQRDFELYYSFASGPFGRSSEMRYEHQGEKMRTLVGRPLRVQWESGAREVRVETWDRRFLHYEAKLRTPLLSALQIVATERLRDLGGYFFHAASLKLLGGTTVLVPGISETGKTTFASGAWVEKLFTDEHSLVDFRGENLSVHGVPFSGREALLPSPGTAPLDLILFLEKGACGEDPEIKDISEKEAREKLLRSMICFDKRPEVFALNLERIELLVKTVPALALRYHPERGHHAVAALQKWGAVA